MALPKGYKNAIVPDGHATETEFPSRGPEIILATFEAFLNHNRSMAKDLGPEAFIQLKQMEYGTFENVSTVYADVIKDIGPGFFRAQQATQESQSLQSTLESVVAAVPIDKLIAALSEYSSSIRAETEQLKKANEKVSTNGKGKGKAFDRNPSA